jgi:hypothetical protein
MESVYHRPVIQLSKGHIEEAFSTIAKHQEANQITSGEGGLRWSVLENLLATVGEVRCNALAYEL